MSSLKNFRVNTLDNVKALIKLLFGINLIRDSNAGRGQRLEARRQSGIEF
jgi:hypothetical protein